MGICSTKQPKVFKSNTDIGEGLVIPRKENLVATVTDETTPLCMTDLAVGKCVFSGFAIGEEGEPEVIVCNNGNIKKKESGDIYLRMIFPQKKWVLQIGPQGLENVSSTSTVASWLVKGLGVVKEKCAATTQVELVSFDDFHMIEHIRLKFSLEGHDVLIEGAVSWRVHAEENSLSSRKELQ